MLHGQHRMARAARPVRDLRQLACQQRQQLLGVGCQFLRYIGQPQAVGLLLLLRRQAQQLATQLLHDLLYGRAPVRVTGMTDGKQ